MVVEEAEDEKGEGGTAVQLGVLVEDGETATLYSPLLA